MKWGVRKDPVKAFTKTYKKSQKLNKKADKYELKGKKLDYRGFKRQARARSARGIARGVKLQPKGRKLVYKAEKYRQKANRWTSKAKKVFGQNNLDYDQMITAREKGLSFANSVAPQIDKAMEKGISTVVKKGYDKEKS